MWLALLAPVLAADLRALAWPRYLEASGRGPAARVAARALLDADPDDLGAHVVWLKQHDSEGATAARAMREAYRRWSAEAPTDASRRAALAVATGIAAARGEADNGFPGAAGAWCDEVLPLFDPLPADPDDRAVALGQLATATARCGRPLDAVLPELASLAETTPGARFALAWALLRDDDVTLDDATAVERAIEAEPWRIDSFGLFKEERTGEGLGRARETLLARAKEEARSTDPMRVAAAVTVLNTVVAPEAVEAVAALRRLDPQRGWFPGVARPAPPAAERGAEAPPDEAKRLGDAVARLAELEVSRPRARDRWGQLAWWSARADVLATLGDGEAALAAMEKAYKLDPGVGSNVRFARAAAAAGTRLRSALRAIDIAVDTYEAPGRASWDEAHGDLAEALRVRALVHRALGDIPAAARDAHLSLLAEESAATRALLGLALMEQDRPNDAFVHLTRALASGTGDTALDAEARAALDELWEQTSWRAPGGLDAWLAAWSAPSEDAPDLPPFPDLTITLDGVETSLSKIPGPLVIDVWATWCGPCRQGLPVLDSTARRHPDVTFIALSVDKRVEEATTFFADAEPGFTVAWAGPKAMDLIGIRGIPATFFLDADHRIVARHMGFSPGSDELEQAVRRLREAGR
jgi:thiol-disulfide isomerase/thioredoxin/tetratricopeptide (TPR) repeat protein